MTFPTWWYRLHERRIALHMDEAELLRRAGMSRSWFADKRDDERDGKEIGASNKTLQKFADALGVSLRWLLDGDDGDYITINVSGMLGGRRSRHDYRTC